MRSADEHQRNELLHRIEDNAIWRLGDDARSSISPFLSLYWARVPLDDIEGRPPDALFGAAFAHWRLAELRPTAMPLVRVYNPRLDEHGWRSEHTVIEVVTDDMPFLVDSLIAELNRQDLAVHLVVHPIVRVHRDASGRLLGVAMPGEPADSALTESFMHVEVTHRPAVKLAGIEENIRRVLSDVRAAYSDWLPTRERLDETIASLGSSPSDEGVQETQAFLQWIRENNFTLLGYRAYEFSREASGRIAHIVDGSGLGLLRDLRFTVFDDLLAEALVPPPLSRFLDRNDLLAVVKADRYSTVHRGVLIDCILTQYERNAEGPAGMQLFIGLFSAAAYNRSARNIPLLRQKLARVLTSAGFEPRSHDGRALANIVETFPRDELFQVSDDQLLEVAVGILHLQYRQRVALFVRRDEFDRFISCLVFVPRDRYSTQLRLAIQRILTRAFDGRVTSHFFQVGDAPLARLHVIIQTTPGRVPQFEVRDIEHDIIAATHSWADRLFDALLNAHGEEEARHLHARYAPSFPLGYRERFSTDQAIADIEAIERALASGGLELALWRPFAASHMQFRFKIYQPDQPLILSHVLPVLEHMGLRVVEEIPHTVRVRADTQRTVMIHDFGLETLDGRAIDIADVGSRFQEAFLAVWEGRAESDGLNALVLSAGLDVDRVRVLRAYVRYLRQARIPFTQAYLERVLTANPEITGAIVRLFLTLFDPDAEGDPADRAAPIRADIAAALDGVASAEDDRILRRILNLVEATQRTTWFQADEHGKPKPYLAVKLDSRSIDDLPLPRPMVEIFVYSPRVEGIHLRGGRVARGGIRWSDRREDFRTEILGLMKAQMVKNAVIVPVGAKGGFVVKQRLNPSDRESWMAEGIACYRTLMRGLLDLTDNRAGGEIIPPPRVVRRDGDDPYLVVAADKGTASFSDIANAVAGDYGFWLGDAFASGGSRGYDHKVMGITARGAWESVKRHFRELGRDIQQEDFTVVGVGDMSGDVFGNGMLLSPHIRLLAAFDHRHIFVDPNPDPATSFAERQRLFALSRSSWADYDSDKLSTGGCIFERSAKVLTLTPEMCACFGIQASRLSPAELISTLLRAEVDLLWFGGIGTFIKAEDETHADAGDRANDAVRVDARTLRCRVIGEGANLGVTQLGRIEYARAGGRINTDFIDNSAGVDCSDHEVNIKILLDASVANGDLTNKQRDRLLVEMTDEVAELVLRDNYLQTQAISIAEAEGLAGLEPSVRQMRRLERQGHLNRAVDFLPDEDALAERAALRQGLCRPEIAVLFSSAKIALNEEILASDLPDDPYLADDVVRYFPSALRQRFRAEIPHHRLRRELIATTITNSLINRMGATFVVDLAEKTGMPAADTARAYIVARDVFAVRGLWDGIEALDGTVPAATQITLHREVQRLIERTTLWFLRNGGNPIAVTDAVERFSQPIAALGGQIESMLPPSQCELLEARASDWQAQGVPEDLARHLARLTVLPAACDIVRAGEVCGVDGSVAGALYFRIGEELGFGWLRQRAEALNTTGYWQRLAVSAVIEELSANQRQVTQHALGTPGSAAAPDQAIADWSNARQSAVDRTRALVAELQAASEVDLPMLAVASRQLRALAES